jgi:hypothetical protein
MKGRACRAVKSIRAFRNGNDIDKKRKEKDD